MFRLGLKPPHATTRRLQLAHYRTTYLPAHPLECDWTRGRTDWGDLGNHRAGDCAIAGPLHQVMTWSGMTGAAAGFTAADAIGEYTAVTAAAGAAYDPATGANDSGCVLQDVMVRWQETGLCGHKIAGWVEGQAADLQELFWGVSVFGGALLGLALPWSAKAQIEHGLPWTLRSRWFAAADMPNSWGPHCVQLPRYGAEEVFLSTWGGLQVATDDWLEQYLAQVMYPVSADWLGTSGRSPSGLDLPGLLADLALLGPVL